MAWVQTGSLRGPAGPAGQQGENGPAGPEGPAGEQGPLGPAGPEGPQGPRGPQGEDGKGISIAGQVATYEDLPTNLTAEDAGQGYLVEADGRLYIWSGTAFPLDGEGAEFQGPAGPEGPAGVQGPEGPQGPAGEQGVQGVQGPEGPAGVQGTLWFTGTGAPGAVPGARPGDLYLDTDNGTYYTLS